MLLLSVWLSSTLLVSCSNTNIVERDLGFGDGHYVIASWYGPKFHGRPTASGEIFDMYKLTCAHRQFPFGTRVKISFPESGKSVLCIVNDRGPFVSGRDIDLSYAAAKRIDLLGPGTGRVLLQLEGRDSAYIKSYSFLGSERIGPFSIQVGSFTDELNAIRLRKSLSLTYDYDISVIKAIIKGRTFHRVRLGKFEVFEHARSVAEKLAVEGYESLIISNE